MKVQERFLRYISVDTTSDPSSTTFPSTKSQLNFADSLVREMKEMGFKDVSCDENGYVFGTIPATIENYQGPVLGFIAHMDTAPASSGANICPRIIENYDGKEIVLNQEKNILMSPSEFENLQKYQGQDLIVTDGTTLLGGDDKAGLAEILTAAEYFLTHPEIPHGTIRIGFTPDEEIGQGADRFDVKCFGADFAYTMDGGECGELEYEIPHGTIRIGFTPDEEIGQGADRFDVKCFGADFAYTMDGGECGELEYENFNAASAMVEITGLSIHPGSAKNKMRNALSIAMEFENLMPAAQKPEHTEGREGFIHLDAMSGSVEHATMEYIIRDHDKTLFQKKKEVMQQAAAYMNKKYGESTLDLQIEDSYFNMKEKIEPHMHLIDSVLSVYEKLDIQPKIVPIRGGTDGARLSYMGLPCPNLGTGDHNCHGHFEFVCIQSMEKCVQVIIELCKLYAEF